MIPHACLLPYQRSYYDSLRQEMSLRFAIAPQCPKSVPSFHELSHRTDSYH